MGLLLLAIVVAAPFTLKHCGGRDPLDHARILSAEKRYAELEPVLEAELARRDDPSLRRALADTQRALGKQREAVANYTRAFMSPTTSAEDWYDFGNYLRRDTHDSIAATRAYQHALELRSSFPEAHFNLGLALMDTGHAEEAAAALEAALSLAPADAPWRPQAETALALAYVERDSK